MPSPRLRYPRTIRVGRGIVIPLGTLVRALVAGARAVQATAADDRDADSPGGVKRTAGEVAEDISAFVAAFGAALLAEVAG